MKKSRKPLMPRMAKPAKLFMTTPQIFENLRENKE
jgi:hypothetical protein